MLSEKQVSFYKEHGYLAVEDVLPQEQVLELQRVTDEFQEKSRSVTENDNIFDLEPDHSRSRPRLRRLKSPANHHPAYERVLRDDGILDIVSQLVGPEIRTNGQKLNMKLGGEGSPVEWHQDWAFYPHTNDDMLAVGVAIDDMTLDNGCLMVIPGSHRGRILDHHEAGHFVGAVTEPDFSPEGAVPVTVKAGGISIHHVRTLHGSAPNVSQAPRRLFLIQYCAVDAWPLTGGSKAGEEFWNTFNSFILRGEPTTEFRVESVPLRIPLPPALRGGSIYENQRDLGRKLFAAAES